MLGIFWWYIAHKSSKSMASVFSSQIERTNQILEDMSITCSLKHGGSWDKSLPFAEFSYNNNYQASLKMAHSKLFMAESVGHLYTRIKQEKVKCLDPKFSKRQKSKYISLERILKQPSQAKELC
jgi:hypothetical protein